MPDLVVDRWYSYCGECGHSKGLDWDGKWAKAGGVLGPDSTECPACGVTFDNKTSNYMEIDAEFRK